MDKLLQEFLDSVESGNVNALCIVVVGDKEEVRYLQAGDKFVTLKAMESVAFTLGSQITGKTVEELKNEIATQTNVLLS